VSVSKGRILLLALVAAVLVADAPPRAPTAHSALEAESRVVAPFDVARIVARSNPTLSDRELGRIGSAVVRYSGKYGLDPALVTAVLLVESSARPWAHSPKGAIGLMQVMPYMASRIGLAGNFSTIESNVEAGCLILAGNIARLGEEDGISAYFWGSQIRGVSYLDRVRAARAEVRRQLHS
jgi:soluble lytic murein transglycosylase-like protein